MLSLFAEATILQIQKFPAKARLISFGKPLRSLVTKVLRLTAVQDSTEFLAPEKLANGVSQAVVHDV